MEYSCIHNHQSQFLEWFGNVTETTSLCEICRPKQWPTIQTKDFTDNGYLVYGANGVIGHYSSYNHEHPTILIACRGASCGAINISEPHSYITGNAMCLDNLSDKVQFEYLAYFLTQYNFSSIISGGAQPQITYTNLQKVEVPIVPIESQSRFVAFYRQADKSKFDGFKSQFLEMFGTESKMVKLQDIATYSIGLTYKPENVSEKGLIVLRSNNIQESRLTLDDIIRVDAPIKESLYVKENDILMCSRNGSASLVGKVAQIKEINEPMTFGAFMTIIRSEHSDYLYGYFLTNHFRNQISAGKSSTMNQITQQMLDSITLPSPKPELETKFSSILRQADKSKFELKRAIEAIDKVIKSLINN